MDTFELFRNRIPTMSKTFSQKRLRMNRRQAIDKSRNSGFDVGFIQDAVARWLKEISAPAQVPPMLYATPFACCLFTSALVLPESLGLATITTFGQLVVAARNVRPEVLPFLQAVV